MPKREGQEQMVESLSKEKAWSEFETVGEPEVMQRLQFTYASVDDEWRRFAEAWLKEQDWKRKRATEAAARSARQAARFSAIAAMISALTALIALILAIP